MSCACGCRANRVGASTRIRAHFPCNIFESGQGEGTLAKGQIYPELMA